MFAKQNIQNLSVEVISDYLHDIILPEMIEKIQQSDPPILNTENQAIYTQACANKQYDHAKEHLLAQYGLEKLTTATVYRWMKHLGFVYEARKKSFYVDGHEKQSTKVYREEYLKRLFADEIRTFRWIQITKVEHDDLVGKGELMNMGHFFIDNVTNIEMVEHHVDNHKSFHERMNKPETPFGGNLSVRINGAKPLIVFGQDESIYKQFLLKSKAWKTPDGESQIVPKDEGAGLMISAFVSRDFGFGLKALTTDQLNMINEARRQKKYCDEEAAKQINGDARKRDLKAHPFCIEFDYGNQHDGYWTYDRMILQLEDCCDVLKTLYPEKYTLAKAR